MFYSCGINISCFTLSLAVKIVFCTHFPCDVTCDLPSCQQISLEFIVFRFKLSCQCCASLILASAEDYILTFPTSQSPSIRVFQCLQSSQCSLSCFLINKRDESDLNFGILNDLGTLAHHFTLPTFSSHHFY